MNSANEVARTVKLPVMAAYRNTSWWGLFDGPCSRVSEVARRRIPHCIEIQASEDIRRMPKNKNDTFGGPAERAQMTEVLVKPRRSDWVS